MKTLSFITFVLLACANMQAGSFVSVLDGNWKDSTIWEGNSEFPNINDQVLIDHIIHSAGICKNLYLSDEGQLCSDVTVDGYIVNYGIIMENSAKGADSITLHFKGDLDNYNTIATYETFLTGTTKQTISAYSNTPINLGICRVVNPENQIDISKKTTFINTMFFGGGSTLSVNYLVDTLKYQGGTIDGFELEGHNTILCCDSTDKGDITEIGWSGAGNYTPQFTRIKRATLESNKYIRINAQGVGALGVDLKNCTNNTSILGKGELYTSSTFTNNNIIAPESSDSFNVWSRNTFINNGTVLATLNILGSAFMNRSATWDQSTIKMNGKVNQEITFNKDILPAALILDANVTGATNYQWYLNGEAINGEKRQRLNIKRDNPTSISEVDGVYHCTTDKGESRTISIIPGFEPPASPKDLRGITQNDTITLYWNTNTERDLAHYKVFVNDSLLAQTTDTFYLYDNFKTGDEYALTAVDVSDYESDKTTISSFIPYSPPAAPSGLEGTAAGQKIILEWVGNTEDDLHHYDIYKNGLLLSHTESNSFTHYSFSPSDTYSVAAVDNTKQTSKKTSISKFTYVPVLLKSNNSFEFSIYPNPTNGHITVTGLTKEASYTIISPNGKAIKTGLLNGDKKQVSTTDLAAGIYTFELTQEGKRSTKRLVVL